MIVPFVANNLFWTEGIVVLGILLVMGVVSYFYFRPLLYLIAFAFVFCVFFFRNPDRVCVQAVHDPSILVCPADGKVVAVEPIDLAEYDHRVAIFLSPLDVHVNWAPIAGRVEAINYHPGKFMPAFLPKSSELNERNDVLVRHENGKTVLVRQIAGTIARRISCWVSEGQKLLVGQKIGMIKFGSRVEVLLPADVEVMLEVGQRVYGGKTILGRWL